MSPITPHTVSQPARWGGWSNLAAMGGLLWMKKGAKRLVMTLWTALLLLPGLVHAGAGRVDLPPPSQAQGGALESALAARRTVRAFTAKPLALAQLGQILWAAYGVTAHRGQRELKTVPSAGATYPLDIYALTGVRGVTGLDGGVYHYQPSSHALRLVKQGDQRLPAAGSCLGQNWTASAPVMIVISGQYSRCTAKYGQRGVMYTHVEAGCSAQNIFLQAQGLGLRAGIVGAFDGPALARLLGLPADHEPLLVMPVGNPR